MIPILICLSETSNCSSKALAILELLGKRRGVAEGRPLLALAFYDHHDLGSPCWP